MDNPGFNSRKAQADRHNPQIKQILAALHGNTILSPVLNLANREYDAVKGIDLFVHMDDYFTTYFLRTISHDTWRKWPNRFTIRYNDDKDFSEMTKVCRRLNCAYLFYGLVNEARTALRDWFILRAERVSHICLTQWKYLVDNGFAQDCFNPIDNQSFFSFDLQYFKDEGALVMDSAQGLLPTRNLPQPVDMRELAKKENLARYIFQDHYQYADGKKRYRTINGYINPPLNIGQGGGQTFFPL